MLGSSLHASILPRFRMISAIGALHSESPAPGHFECNGDISIVSRSKSGHLNLCTSALSLSSYERYLPHAQDADFYMSGGDLVCCIGARGHQPGNSHPYADMVLRHNGC